MDPDGFWNGNNGSGKQKVLGNVTMSRRRIETQDPSFLQPQKCEFVASEICD